MYVKPLGSLGQTASTQFTVGSTVSLQFALDTEASIFLNSSVLQDVQNGLAAWSPFSSGAFQLQSVSLDDPSSPTVLTVTFTVGQNGAQYEYGLLSQSIATVVNSSISGTVSPIGIGAGLSPAPSTAAAVVSALTLNPSTLAQSWANLLSGGSVNTPGPPGPAGIPSWVLWAAAALALVAVGFSL